MTKLVSSDGKIAVNAISRATASAVKIEASFGSLLDFSSILNTKETLADPTTESDFEPSV